MPIVQCALHDTWCTLLHMCHVMLAWGHVISKQPICILSKIASGLFLVCGVVRTIVFCARTKEIQNNLKHTRVGLVWMA